MSEKPRENRDETIRERVRRWMAFRGVSQSALARETGVYQQTISRYLAGKQDVGTECADRLLAALERGRKARSGRSRSISRGRG